MPFSLGELYSPKADNHPMVAARNQRSTHQGKLQLKLVIPKNHLMITFFKLDMEPNSDLTLKYTRMRKLEN